MRVLPLIVVAAGCGSSLPDNGPPPAMHGCDGCTALVGARLFDGEKALDGTVVLQGDRIVEVLDAATAIDRGEVVRLDGKTILPGLIDLHVHVLREPGPYGFYGADPMDNHFKPMLRAGVTSALDLGASAHVIFEYRARIRAGGLLAPNLFAAGPMLTPTGGHPCYAGSLPGDSCVFVDEPDAASVALAQLLPLQPDVVKIILEPGAAGTLPRMTDDAIAAVVKGAGAAPVVAHVGKSGDVADGLAAGVTRFAHVPMEDAFAPDLCARLAAAHAVVIPTLAVADGLYRLSHGEIAELADPALADDVAADTIAALQDPQYVAPMQSPSYRAFTESLRANAIANFQACRAAGVRFAAGTDAGNPATFHGLALRRELALYVAAGMPPADALATATSHAADFLGRADLGRLAAGARADLLVVDGDATADVGALAHVARVYLGGQLVDRDALALPQMTSLVRKPASAGAGATCLHAGECGAMLFCDYDDRCVAACTVGMDASCGPGAACFSQSADGSSSDGYCFKGDGCDVWKQDCPNQTACLWIGNGATTCYYAGPAKEGDHCKTTGCQPGLQCDYYADRCERLCDPTMKDTCGAGTHCADYTAYAGFPVGMCAPL